MPRSPGVQVSPQGEFGKFGDVLARTKAQLETVANTIDQAEVRTRQIERKLKDVEVLPGLEPEPEAEEQPAANILRLPRDEPGGT